MKKFAYYNDVDEFACEWARELVRHNIVPDGVVDCRPIQDVQPEDLKEFAQCHFFSGILGWAYAIRLAGIPDDYPIWTGSCPCQPFSSAGKRRGTDDERHLWPEFYRLIAECRPPVVAGEQVASKAGRSWLAGVRADLEALGYGVGAADLCAAGIGAPHIRQRLWLVAEKGLDDTTSSRCSPTGEGAKSQARNETRVRGFECGCESRSAWDGIYTPCADGKERRIEPSIEPLVDGLPRGVVPSSRQGMEINANATAEGRQRRLKGYGNAIVPQVAAEFLIAYMETRQ